MSDETDCEDCEPYGWCPSLSFDSLESVDKGYQKPSKVKVESAKVVL